MPGFCPNGLWILAAERFRTVKIRALTFVSCICLGAAATAGDWPQILGPSRSGKASNENIADRLASPVPKLLWEKDVGAGYAGPAVADGRAVIYDRRGDQVVCEAFDAATGQRYWMWSYATGYMSSIAPDNGPRCVPLIHDGWVYLLSAEGDLHCLSLSSAKKRWHRNLRQDFHAPEGYFGFGSTPIIDSRKLLVNIGGDGAGLVALSLTDGKTLWKATDAAASYSSPIAAKLDGSRHVIFVTRLEVISVAPQTGSIHFRFPFGMRGPTVNAANPVLMGDRLFVTANYGIGAQWYRIKDAAAERLWESDEVLSSQYTTPIEHEGILYGIDGRQDAGVARLRAIDPQAKRVLWTEEGFGTATLILADEKLLIMKTDGTLVLARPSPKAYEELGSVKLFDDTVQALPALSNGRFYARDTRLLRCYDLGK